MSNLLALIRYCKENPDDDIPRLVLADWMEEHGDPERAEFIRLQCAMSAGSLPWAQGSPRADELFNRNRTRWLGELNEQGGFRCFRRGFIQIGNRSRSEAQLNELSSPEVEWIDAFKYSFTPSGGCRLGPLTGAPFMRELVEIDLWADDEQGVDWDGTTNYVVGRDVLHDLLAVPELPLLRKLSIRHYEFTPDDFVALLQAPWFAQVTHLVLVRGWAGRTLCRLLGTRRTTTGLTSLSVYDESQGLDDQAVAALCQATHLKALRELDLSHNASITDDGLRALAGSALLGRLHRISLRGCQGITDDGIAAFANSPNAVGLRELDLSSTRIGQQGANALVGSSTLSQLRLVTLLRSALTEELSQGRSADELQRLRERWGSGRVKVSF
jgi:uncharacterized protein (TIGR02996 family)